MCEYVVELCKYFVNYDCRLRVNNVVDKYAVDNVQIHRRHVQIRRT